MPTVRDPTARLRAAADRVRGWFQRRLDDQALDLARLYASQRDRFITRISQVYQAYLADDPTLMRARQGPAGLLLDQAISETAVALADELGARAVNGLTEILGQTPAQVRRLYREWQGLDFADLPPAAQMALRELTTSVVGGGTFFDRAFNITDTLRTDLIRTLRQSLINGDDFTAVRARVHKLFGVDTLGEPAGAAYGSVRIYRNSAAAAWNRLMQDIAEEAGGVQVWWATLDERTTPGCAARHGRRISELRGEIPPRHYNSVTGDTLVQGHFVTATRMLYAGQIRHIKLRSGQTLTVTPNHAVLTDRGMQPAGRLQEGDYLLAYRGGLEIHAAPAVPGIPDHEQHGPARIENVFEAIRKTGVRRSVRRVGHEFHGDAAFGQGEIDVVSVDPALWDDGPEVEGAQDGLGVSLEPAALLYSFHAPSRHRDLMRLGVSSPFAALAGGHRREGGLDVATMAPPKSRRIGQTANLDALVLETLDQHRTRDVGFSRQLIQRATGAVLRDQVVEVRDVPFHGYVYDLQSVSGVIVANDSIISNCRCSLAVFEPGVDLDEIRAEADVWLADAGYSRRQAARMEARREAFDPGQPREPAGSPEGGQWTATGGGGGVSAPAATRDGARASPPRRWAIDAPRTRAQTLDAFLGPAKVYDNFLGWAEDLHLSYAEEYIPSTLRRVGTATSGGRTMPIAVAGIRGEPRNVALLAQWPDGTWEPIGAYRGDTLGISQAWQGRGLSIPLILAAAERRGGVPNPSGAYSPAGLAAHKAAWRYARQRAEEAEAYDPNQPRVPAGSPEGGRWTKGGGGGGGDDEGGGRARSDRSGTATRSPAARQMAPLEPKVADALARFEAWYAVAEIEHARAVAPDGTVILDDFTSGRPNYIHFSPEHVQRMTGRQLTFTHNHPAGRSFSLDDIRLASELGLAEVRAVTRGAVFRMRPGPKGWPPAEVLKRAYARSEGTIYPEFRAAIDSGRMTVAEAEALHFHLVWRLAAATTPDHLLYAREARAREAFDPGQPREPAGSPEGGQWAATGGGGGPDAGGGGDAPAAAPAEIPEGVPAPAYSALPALPGPLRGPIEGWEVRHAAASRESVLGVSPDGVTLIDKLGEQATVRMSREEIAALSGREATITHNHPIEASFSLDDIRLATRIGAAEVRAVTRRHVYRLRPGPQGWMADEALRARYEAMERVVYGTLRPMVRDGRLAAAQASALHHDLVWRRLAAEHPEHLLYSREEAPYARDPGRRLAAGRSAAADLRRRREAFDPDQPRVPAGDPEGGQWTAGPAGPGGLRDGGGVSGRAPDVDSPRGARDPRRLAGLPADSVGPSPTIRRVAELYMQATGRPYTPPTEYVDVDPTEAARVAEAYEAMPHAPDDPEVRRAYAALIEETRAQYQAMRRAGVRISVIDLARTGDPYQAGGARAMHEDLRDRNHLWLFPTSAGFGSDASVDVSTNPLLRKTGERIGDYELTANDLFRVVHDYFGHAKEGFDFSPAGEENAWRMHRAMYSPLAARAMTAETRGQASWVYYGPHGARNRRGTDPIVFAPQKTGLLPAWVSAGRGREVAADGSGRMLYSDRGEGPPASWPASGDVALRLRRGPLSLADRPGHERAGHGRSPLDPARERGRGADRGDDRGDDGSGWAGGDGVTPTWGAARLRPLLHVRPVDLVESHAYTYQVRPWSSMPALAIGELGGDWSRPERVLASGSPDAVLVRRRRRRRTRAVEVLTVEGWAPVIPADPHAVWLPVPGGRALDGPAGAHWQPRAQRFPLDVIEAWPALRAVVVPPASRWRVAAVEAEEAEAIAIGDRPAPSVATRRDFEAAVREALADRAGGPHLVIATPDDRPVVVLDCASGALLYSREADSRAAPYERAAVAVFDGEGLVWAIRPHGRAVWALPGGHLAPGERPVDAAVRELAEETGLHVDRPRYLGRLYRPWSTTHVFVATRRGPPDLPTTPDEIDAVQVVTLDDLDPSERAFLVRHRR